MEKERSDEVEMAEKENEKRKEKKKGKHQLKFFITATFIYKFFSD